MFIKIIQLTIGFIMLSIFNVAIAGCVTSSAKEDALNKLALKENAKCITGHYLERYYVGELPYHAGIDLRAQTSLPAYSIVSGKVRYEKASTGKIIIRLDQKIDDKTVDVIYLHMSKVYVNSNNRVTVGQHIGQTGSTDTSAPHLHIEARTNYTGTSGLGFISCPNKGCDTKAKVKAKTIDPIRLIGINGGLSVKDFWHKADPIYTNSSFDAQFKLQNNSQSGVTVKDVAMSIHGSNNNFLFNMFLKKSKVDIPAGSYYQVPKTYKNAPSTAGTYKVVAKIQEDNGNWKELKSDPFVVRAKSDSGSNNNDKASQYIDKCISTLSKYCGSKVGEKYSCKENSLCQKTTGTSLTNVTNIAIDKNITGNEFYYYWDAYGGWSKNGLTLSYCGIAATTTDNSANKADGFENRWKSSVKLTVDGNNSWKIIDKSDGYFNICQSSDTNKCLHNEYGSLQLSDIQTHWFSAQWYFEDAENGYIRIRNKWKQSEYIHIENGSPAVGGIESGWLSAQWKRFKF